MKRIKVPHYHSREDEDRKSVDWKMDYSQVFPRRSRSRATPKRTAQRKKENINRVQEADLFSRPIHDPISPNAGPSQIKDRIKEFIIAEPLIRTDDLMKKMEGCGIRISAITLGNIRMEFRETVKWLHRKGLLDETKIDISTW